MDTRLLWPGRQKFNESSRSHLCNHLEDPLIWLSFRQLQSLDTAKTLFFSNTSHELRTPLTLISGPLEDAIRHLKDDKIEESLKLAMRNVGRLTRMVDTLLDFSRLNAGRLQACFKPAYLGAYTLSLANLFRGTIERNNIAVRLSVGKVV
jgi:signal transduction histidine kinase